MRFHPSLLPLLVLFLVGACVGDKGDSGNVPDTATDPEDNTDPDTVTGTTDTGAFTGTPTDTGTTAFPVCAESQFGSGRNDITNGVALDGGILYVAGQRDCDVDPEDGRTPIGCTAFLMALDPADPATPLWEATLDSTDAAANDEARALAVTADAVYVIGQTDGDLLPPCEPLAGTTPVEPDGTGNAFLVRYPLSPSVGMDGQMECDWYDLFGTKNLDEALGIAVRGNDVWVSGGTVGTLGAEKFGDEDAYVRHVDATGAVAPCTYQFGGVLFEESMGVDDVEGGAIAVGWTGNELEAGAFKGAQDAFIVHVDTACQSDWLVQMGSSGEDAGQGIFVLEESGGHAIYITGRTSGELVSGEDVDPAEADNDIYLARFDWDGLSTPARAWAHQFGTDAGDIGQAIAADATQVFVIGAVEGGTDHAPSVGTEEAVVVPFDHAGNRGEPLLIASTDEQADEGLTGVLVDGVLVVGGSTEGALCDDISDPQEGDLAGDGWWRLLSTDGSCD